MEIETGFGLKPFFKRNTFHYETIIDIPYIQIIYTSGKWFPLRSVSNVNEETTQTTNRSTGTGKN